MEPEGPDPVEPAVCADRPGCRVETELVLDRGPEGRELLAVVARLAPHEMSRADHTIAEREIVLGGPNLCAPFETSIVSRSGRAAERLQTLVTDCLVDAIPAPPVVEKRADGVIRYRISSRLQSTDPTVHLRPMYGASEVTDFAVDPPRILRTTRREYADRDPAADRETTWDWQAFGGQDCWPNSGGCTAILPYVAVPGAGTASGGTAALKMGGWKTTSLGECAMRLDGSTASVRLVKVDDVTLVEVTDDHFVTQGSIVDAVEAVIRPEDGMPDAHALHQRLTMDGRLSDNLGRKRQVEVVEVSPTTRRFALSRTWPPDSPYWSLAYVDTDDGRTVHERLAPPSAGEHGQPVADWWQWRATCTVANGTLEPVHSPAPRSADE